MIKEILRNLKVKLSNRTNGVLNNNSTYSYLILKAKHIKKYFQQPYYTFCPEDMEFKITKTYNSSILVLIIALICITLYIGCNVQLGNSVNATMNYPVRIEPLYIEGESGITELSSKDTRTSDSILYTYICYYNPQFPKIILAQAKLESGDYKSTLFRKNNNLFGMKRTSSWKANTQIGTDMGYATYEDWRNSVIDYILWQSRTLNKKLHSEEQYFQFLIKARYAEDPNYINKLRAILKTIDI